MQSEPSKLVFTGLLVGAVAIGAYVTQSGKHWLSTDEFGVSRDDTSSQQQSHADTMSGTVIPAPATARNDLPDSLASDLQAARENHLQAARESLQRNDLVAAQSQLNAVSLGHPDDPQVHALQREVQMRALASMAAVETPPATTNASRETSSTQAKNGGAQESHTAARGHSGRPASSKTRLAGNTRIASAGGGKTVHGHASSATSTVASENRSAVSKKDAGNVAATKSPTLEAPTQHAGLQSPPQIASPATAESLPQSASRPAPAAALTAQTAPPSQLTQSSTSTGTGSGPLTRAQVRAQIARARLDGSLPAFGNPDPAGPGGAPSMTMAPRP